MNRLNSVVMTADGHVYERQAIEAWLQQLGARRRSPITNLALEHSRLAPNYAIKAAVEEWQQRQGA